MWGRDPSPPPAESGGSASGSGSSSPSERRSLPTPTEDRARLMLSDGEEVMRQGKRLHYTEFLGGTRMLMELMGST